MKTKQLFESFRQYIDDDNDDYPLEELIEHALREEFDRVGEVNIDENNREATISLYGWFGETELELSSEDDLSWDAKVEATKLIKNLLYPQIVKFSGLSSDIFDIQFDLHVGVPEGYSSSMFEENIVYLEASYIELTIGGDRFDNLENDYPNYVNGLVRASNFIYHQHYDPKVIERIIKKSIRKYPNNEN